MLDDQRNRPLDEAPPHGTHNDLQSSKTGTQLHVFVWRNSCSSSRYLVCASLGLSSPDILESRIFPDRAWCCTHKSPTAKCRTFPNPSRWTIPIAALASDLIATWPHKQKSFKIDCSPIPSIDALTPLLKARTPIVLDHAVTNWSLHIAIPLTVDFLEEWHPAMFASPNTSSLLSNWVHGYLQVIRWYLIVYRATLLRAVRSCVCGEAIFRINSFTQYKRSGLSIARKLNLAATLWNSFNSSPVRRSSFPLTSSGGLCHFAVLRRSLIWLALGPPTSMVPGVATPLASVNPKSFKARDTCCWSGLYSIPHRRNVSILPKKLAVCDCDGPGPRVTTLLSSYAIRSKLSACLRPSCRSTMKQSSQCTRMWVCEPFTEKLRLGKILPPPQPEHCVLPNVGRHPKNRTLSFAISLTRMAALPWGPRLAVGRGRREPHQRRSGLDSRLQWR